MNTTKQHGTISIIAHWMPSKMEVAYDFYYNDRLFRFQFATYEVRILHEGEERRFDDQELENWEKDPEASMPPEPVVYYISINQHKWTEIDEEGEPVEQSIESMAYRGMNTSYNNGIAYGRIDALCRILTYSNANPDITKNDLLLWIANLK